MQSNTIYPCDHLVRLRLLQRYMSAGTISLVISRGGSLVSILLLIAGGAFIVVGRFYLWERYTLYGCRADYTTSIATNSCPLQWQKDAISHMDTATVACLVTGSTILLTALLYPYALLAIKGNREETEEVRSIIHLEYHSVTKSRGNSLGEWERPILHLLGLRHSFPLWNYFHHENLKSALSIRRRLRKFSACLWTEMFTRVVLQEYTFAVIICLFALASTAVSPCLMTESTAILRISSAVASLVAYVAITTVSVAAFLVILVIDPSAWMGCLTFLGVYLTIHFIGFTVHKWASAVPRLLDYTMLPRNVPSTVLQSVLKHMF